MIKTPQGLNSLLNEMKEKKNPQTTVLTGSCQRCCIMFMFYCKWDLNIQQRYVIFIVNLSSLEKGSFFFSNLNTANTLKQPELVVILLSMKFYEIVSSWIKVETRISKASFY